MACHSRGDYGGAAPAEVLQSTKLHCSDSVVEWRSREQLEPSPPSTSPATWDSDDEDDTNSSSIVGPKPSELYGKFTWKIENFSEISKRELRSNVFEVGGYKWYILVYPQGCDVCNHLSLFLCVADYDKLLPGWSHFAQFTIAVVNKDPKKSKYSDTLHRFCKKEHDWGWKKFMELSKVLDGFTVADTLVIKAQVQVIRENHHRPFRCLDCQYRRELVRVYLTNVEGICRRFVEEKREKLGKLMEDTPRWISFRTFWSAVEEDARERLAREKTDVILKAVVKRFFNEKEVTSTLVMDALYSGCKALDYRTRNKKGKINGVDLEEAASPVVFVDKDAFVLAGDVVSLLERAVAESLPAYKDDKGPQNRTKDVGSGDDFGKDSVERDERRLTELGRRTVEMFVLAHLYTNHVEVAYREAVALKRQEELIREEEAAGQAETEMRIKREAAEKEKRSKKKQAKQRRKDRKDKDKDADEKKVRVEQEQRQRRDASSNNRLSKENSDKERDLFPAVSIEAGEDEDDLSGLDPTDDVVIDTLGPAVEDGDVDRAGWEREAAYAQNVMEASFSGAVLPEASRTRGISRKQLALDDSSSTCSSDSLPSVRTAMNDSFAARPTLPEQSHANPSNRSGEGDIYETDSQYTEADGMLRAAAVDVNGTGEPCSSTSSVGLDSETVILSLKDRVRWLEQRLFEKEEEVVLLQEQLSLFQHQIGLDQSTRSLGEEAIDLSRVRSRDAVLAEEGRDETSTSFFHSDGGDARLNGHIGSSNGNVVAASRSTFSGGFGGHEQSYAQGPSPSPDLSRSTNAPSRSRSVDLSRPPRLNPTSIAGFSAAVSGPLNTTEETGLPHPPSSTSAGTGLSVSRPFSSPGVAPSTRPNVPLASPLLHPPQSLARSMSVGAGRTTAGADATSNGPHMNGVSSQSPPVTPSYKNATIGKTRSLSGAVVGGHPLPSYSNISGGAVSVPMSGVTTSYGITSSAQNASHGLQQAPSTSISLSPPPTPSQKMRAGPPGQPLPSGANGAKAETGGPALSNLSVSSGIEASPVNHNLRENSGGSSGGPPSMGFTFGTVTPELLQDDRKELPTLQEPQSHDDGSDRSPQEKESQQLQRRLQQNILRYSTAQQMLQHQHNSSEGAAAEANGGPGIPSSRRATSSVPLIESINSGAVMSEDFPHLDIINDLLDEDQNLGMALRMLQHPSALGYNRPLSLAGHKLNYGSAMASDRVNSLGGEVGDRSRAGENGEERSSSNGSRDSARVNAPFQHPPPLPHLHGQHPGVLDGASSPYWPMRSSAMPSGGTGNNAGRNGLVDSHLAYSLVQGHHAVPDCTGFALGHNGYTVYAPAQQP